MKRLILLLAVIGIAIFAWGCKEEEKPSLIMVTEASFPPYEYVSGSRIDGIDPEIIRRIAARIGCDLEIMNMNFDSLLSAVQSGKADIAASGITVTEERRKQVLFSDSYVTAAQVIIVKKDSPIRTVKDLAKVNIAVQHGTTGDFYVSKNIKDPQRFAAAPLAVSALLAGKAEVVVVDREPAHAFISRNPELKILPEPLTSEEYAFAISRKNPELCRKINAELQKMRDSGELEAIIKHYKALNLENIGTDVAVQSADAGFMHRFKDSFYTNFVKENRYQYLLKGFVVTLKVTVFSVMLGIVIGFAVAVIRSAADQTGKLKIANLLCRIYLTVIRGTPVVVQLLIIYFVIFNSVNIDKVLVAVIAFGINSGAYVAEIIRGGIMAIDKGQMEAGRSLGLSYIQTMWGVILPQAFKNVLPSLGNEFIVLLKETSVAGYIALQDLTKGGDIIRSQTYDAFLPLIAVALIYLVVVIFLSHLLSCLEKRLKRNE